MSLLSAPAVNLRTASGTLLHDLDTQPADDHLSQSEPLACAACTFVNPAAATACEVCGAALQQQPQQPQQQPQQQQQQVGGSSSSSGARGGFVPPTAGTGRPADGSPGGFLPPQHTMDGSGGQLPPQDTLSPHALAAQLSPPHTGFGSLGHTAASESMQSAQPLQQRQGSSQAFSPQTRRDDRHAAQPLQQRQGSSQAFSPQTRGHDRHAVSQGSDHPGSSQAALGRTQPAVASSSGYSAGAGRSRPGAAPSAAHSRPQTGPQHGGAGAAPAGSAPLPGGLAGRKLTLRVLRAFDLRNTALGILPGDASDPFVVARLGGQEFKTQVVENSLNPVWNSQQFDFIVEDDDADPRLQLEIFSSNNWHANDSLGRLDVLVRNLTPGQAHTVLERVDEGEMPREDRKRGRLQVEVQLDGLMGGQSQSGGQQLATQQQAVASRGQHRAHNPVPLPSFKGMGPEAFEAPKPSVEVAKVGEQRRLMEYESLACRLGQYDYTRAPSYYPKQEVTDKRQWKEDPFHGWRRELDRVEHNAPPPAMRGGGASHGRGVLSDRNHEDEEHQEYWKKDPFHGWLQHDKGGQPEHLAGQGAGLERLQEAQAARQLQSLPSFRDAPARRFDDHREYASHEATPEPRERLSATRAAPQGGRRATGGEAPHHNAGPPEQRWKDDAFFGWLPGRGPASEEQHKLRRPLEQARLMRLPSFAEGAEALSGVTGRGVGVVSVWVNGAFDLAYSHGSGLRGKPSACVQLALKSTGGGSNGSTNQKPKLTETVALEANPRWNSPVMLFEVLSITDVLQLEVLDLANPRGEQHLHQYFLGRSSLPIQRILEMQRGHSANQHFRETLEGSQQQAKLDFEVLYEPYDTEQEPYDLPVMAKGTAAQSVAQRNAKLGTAHQGQGHQGHGHQGQYHQRHGQWHGGAAQAAPTSSMRRVPHGEQGLPDQPRTLSTRSSAESEVAQLGVLSVRIIAAYNLTNADTGLFGDVSDPYVSIRLQSHGENQRKRTQTINNDLNPKWDTSPFLFPLVHEDDQLILEVWDEDMLTSDDFLGRMSIPLYRIIKGQPNRAVPIRDKLLDIESGELEVEIGFSPG